MIPIGVDVSYFADVHRGEALGRAGLEPGNSYVVFVGHFASWVDFDTLLGAFATVVGERPDARLLLVGDGEQRAEVEATIQALSIERTVMLTGYLRDRDAVRDVLASATVLVASHRGEHLNRIGMNATKIAEYLASGRAVVAKDVARLREMIEETGAGLVARDAEEMAAAIGSLLDPARADASATRAGRSPPAGTRGTRRSHRRWPVRLLPMLDRLTLCGKRAPRRARARARGQRTTRTPPRTRRRDRAKRPGVAARGDLPVALPGAGCRRRRRRLRHLRPVGGHVVRVLSGDHRLHHPDTARAGRGARRGEPAGGRCGWPTGRASSRWRTGPCSAACSDAARPRRVQHGPGGVRLGVGFPAQREQRYARRRGARATGCWPSRAPTEPGGQPSVMATAPVFAYNVRCAWALIYAAQALDEPRFAEAAQRAADWTLQQQNEAGWFAHSGFAIGEVPLLHTIAYVIEGLLGVHCFTREPRYLRPRAGPWTSSCAAISAVGSRGVWTSMAPDRVVALSDRRGAGRRHPAAAGARASRQWLSRGRPAPDRRCGRRAAESDRRN